MSPQTQVSSAHLVKVANVTRASEGKQSHPRKVNSARRISATSRALLLLLILLATTFLTACPKDKKPESGRVGVSTRPKTEADYPPNPIVAFNGERAMDHARAQVAFGPRPSGSAELAQTRSYITSELKKSGLRVMTDEFLANTPIGDREMANITGELAGELKDVIIIASHYETKFYRDMHFVGANDPAASVGAVLELARVLSGREQKPKFTYWFVFFDGEEAFCENWDDCSRPGRPDNTYGSRHYVEQLRERAELIRVRSMILLDLIGYEKLQLGRDTLSTRWLQDVIWQTGKEMGYRSIFVDRGEGIGSDDHEPFLKAGIAAVDLIQLSSYPHWHKPSDTLDKISARSLKIVGDVVLESLPRIEERILKGKNRDQ